MTGERISQRRRTLENLGASVQDTDSLLAYNRPLFLPEQLSGLRFPLPDESFVAAWKIYGTAVQHEGSLTALFPYLPELAPVPQSADGSRRVTGQDFTDACQGRVIAHPTLVGMLPVIVAGSHHDFVVLVQALARRGAAGDLPDSMGALFLGNYKNRSRYDVWLAEHLVEAASGLSVPKEAWIDCFAMLRPGAYSGVAASEFGLTDDEWNRCSLQIRLEHECTHYFTRRVFGAARINVLDELLADFNALRLVIGSYNPDWQRRFLGLEDAVHYRTGGRLENYFHGSLSAGACAIIIRMVRLAIKTLAEFDRQEPIARGDTARQAAVLAAVACSSLEDLAASDAAERLHACIHTETERLLPGA